MISLDDVTFTFRSNNDPALINASLEVDEGEFVVICGRSGCGKSTLLKLINGVVPGHEEGELTGSVTVAGLDPQETSIPALSASVGSVFQHPRAQLFSLDTTDELFFGSGNHRVEPSTMLDRLHETVAAFDIEPLLGRSIFDLSGGEAQKIVCASTHMIRPAVYVLDEPSANLDGRSIDELAEVLAALKRSGATIVVAEHRLYYLMELCDRVLYLDNGAISAEFSATQFRALTANERTSMGLRTIERPRMRVPSGSTTEPDPAASHDDRGPLRVERLRFRRRRTVVLDVQNLELPRHEVIALTGPNGAGKSTFVAGFTGALRADAAIHDEQRLSRRTRLRRSAVVMQDVHHQLFGESVLDEVVLGHELDDEETRANATEVLETLGLQDRQDVHPYCLSGGEKQRTAIAAALLAGTRYLVFDEPTSGIDRDHMERFGRRVQDIKASLDLVLVVTHDVEFINTCADHVIELAEGRVIGEHRLAR
ncbi:MAG: ABC transporter ATP-binding protein [Actinomycetota bacterium]